MEKIILQKTVMQQSERYYNSMEVVEHLETKMIMEGKIEIKVIPGSYEIEKIQVVHTNQICHTSQRMIQEARNTNRDEWMILMEDSKETRNVWLEN